MLDPVYKQESSSEEEDSDLEREEYDLENKNSDAVGKRLSRSSSNLYIIIFIDITNLKYIYS